MEFSKTNELALKRSFVSLPNNHKLDGNMPKESIVNANLFLRRPARRDLASSAQRSRLFGATMVEYAFMVMLIAIVCVATISTIGTKLSTVYNTVASDF
jgi:Flp pilus assembly pilin Flp